MSLYDDVKKAYQELDGYIRGLKPGEVFNADMLILSITLNHPISDSIVEKRLIRYLKVGLIKVNPSPNSGSDSQFYIKV